MDTDTRDKLSRYSDQEIEDAFTAGFERPASLNYLESYDVTSELTDDGQHRVVVGVAVMASSPTRDEFEKIEELKQVVAKFDYDMAEIPFVLHEILPLNTMEFQAIYVPGKLAPKEEVAPEVEEAAPEADAGVSDLVGSSPAPQSSEEEESAGESSRDWIPSQEG